ncbi:MAG TPA: long-chain fatty acid--CoA ligase [Candidatus Acidoferrum sp.]|nr:long-chain fatty acid--CoA ligase [Candidatus Acidoferrum sp.]
MRLEGHLRKEIDMHGTMMDYSLVLPEFLERAGKLFPKIEIISRKPDRTLVRSSYGALYERAKRLASALTKLGVQPGDRVASMMWNHAGHLEVFFGVPCSGAILHTLNLRLHPQEIANIANHAQDRFLIIDDVLLPVYEQFAKDVKFEKVIVVPYGYETVPRNYANYEEVLATGSSEFCYPKIAETDGATMCFTSGTTGFSKGVVYTHRSVVLHSMAEAMVDTFAVSHQDVLLPLAPMFHANAWGVPYTAVMTGAKMVLMGPNVEPSAILDLMISEKVTAANAVPTVWISVLEELEKNPGRWHFDRPVRIVSGGSAPPLELMRKMDRFGLRILHLWGLTETSPLATTGHLKSRMQDWSEERKYLVRAKQGWPVPLIELRIMRPEGEAPWDGETVGEVEVRGPWVAGSYYREPDQAEKWSKDGWFRTGDMGTIDPEGILKIVDRSKDLVKSGGEWISSVDLENALMGHPAIREACVVGVPHPRWQERPLALLVLKQGANASKQEIREFLAKDFAGWQMPDEFVFVETIPKTSVGKFKKTTLREQYASWKWRE